MKKAVLLTLIFVSVIASGTTYYVSTSGSNSNNGLTQSTPWATPQWAESHTIAGDIIALKRGDTWATSLAIDIRTGGTSGNPITWDGGLWGTGANAIITATGNRADGNVALICITGCQYVTIQNITFDGRGYDLEGVVIGGGSDRVYGPRAVQGSPVNERFITIQDCSIINIGTASTNYCLSMLIQSYNNDMYDITVRRCIIDRSSNWGIAGYQGREEYGATPSTMWNFYAGYNTISNIGLNGDGRGAGIGLTQSVKGAILEHNTITQGSGKVMGITTAGENASFPANIIIRYNDIRMGNEPAVVIGNGGPQTIDTYCNKFSSVNISGAGTVTIYPHDFTGAKLNFWNNTIVATSGGGFDNGASYATTLVNNLFDDNSNTVDPLFINKASFDYHLQVTSPYKGAGVNVASVTVDFDGKPFGNPRSVGAFEYGTVVVTNKYLITLPGIIKSGSNIVTITK